jgi:PST family polysaccharide transporter
MISEKRTIIENYLSLIGVQFANYFLQLITFPYLVRTLGFEGFGLYAFVLSFAQYFLVITDYSFSLTATRDISIVRDDKKKISEIYSAVMAVKLILFSFCIVIMVILILFFQKFRMEWTLYVVSLLGVLGNFLFPVWFYQGIEKTKYIAFFNGIARITVTVCMFLFVKTQGDVIVAVFIQSMGVVLASIISLVVMFKYWSVKIVLPTKNNIVITIRDGWNIFVTLFSATLVNNTNVFILGILTNNQTVGYFAVADKIARVFHSLVSPLSAAIYPRVSKLFNESKSTAVLFLRKVIFMGGIGFLCCSIILFVFSGLFVKLFTGSYSWHIQKLVMILSILPLSIFMDNIYGQQVLVNIGRTKEFMKGILFPGIGSLLLSFLLVPLLKDYGSALLFLTSQLAILFLMIYYVRKMGIYLIKDGVI